MKILVTGGLGFIGSHIVDVYIKKGCKVIVVDNLYKGLLKNKNPKAKTYILDIRNYKKLEKLFKKYKFDMVNHQAAFADVALSIKQPDLVVSTNIQGTVNLLELSVKYNVKKFIFASTGGAIHGKPKKLPVQETDSIEPLSTYGLSKFIGEEFIKLYSRLYGLKYLIFRYPNVYGSRQRPDGESGVVAIWGNKAIKKESLILYGNGSKTRDYCYVSDIVRAHLLGLKKGENQILNLGWGKEIRDDDILEGLYHIFGCMHISLLPVRLGEVRNICLNFSKAKRILNWQPKIKLKEGIKKTINYLKNEAPNNRGR